MLVFGDQRLLRLKLAGMEEIFVRKAVVFALQVRLGHEEIADARSGLAGRVGKFLQRIEHDGNCLAHGFHVLEAGVGIQQDQGQEGKETEAGKEARASLEEGRRRVFHPRGERDASLRGAPS